MKKRKRSPSRFDRPELLRSRPPWKLSIRVVLLAAAAGAIASPAAPPAPRVETVVLAATQPHDSDPRVIWHDDFDQDRIDSYLEPAAGSPNARLSDTEALGNAGRSMECFYPKGGRGVGNRKLVFGDSPIGRPIHPESRYEDVYWRIYVKHQAGWIGSPAKMSRATGIVSSKWNQAFILHVWSSGPPLTLDPVSGVRGDQVVTTRYNDFDHFKWLGNSPKGRFPLHATEESGRWVCVEARIRLNTPGRQDGYAALWVDGRLDTERTGMNFRGAYTGTGGAINAIFLEAYWNEGSPIDQYRWYDDFVVSTAPIGPLTAPANPTLIRTPAVDCAEWELEAGSSDEEPAPVWTSHRIPGGTRKITIDSTKGTFSGELTGKTRLLAGKTYFSRVRQRDTAGQWSDWSPWHQPFAVEAQPAAEPNARLEIERLPAPTELRLKLTAPTAGDYSIETTGDFRSWRPWTNATLEGGVAMLDEVAESSDKQPGKFYRARLQSGAVP